MAGSVVRWSAQADSTPAPHSPVLKTAQTRHASTSGRAHRGRSEEHIPQSATMILSTFPAYASYAYGTHGRPVCVPKSWTSRRYRNAASKMEFIVSARKMTPTCTRSCQAPALMLGLGTYKRLHPRAVSVRRTRRERALSMSAYEQRTP
jgi:hypothetical protein